MNHRLSQQFSLLALFTTVTLLCILFTTYRLDWHLGCIVATVFIGIAATAVGIGHGYYTLAYLISAFTCGQLTYLAAAFPFSVLPFFVAWYPPCIASSLYFGSASLIATTALRIWWRGDECPLLCQAVILSYATPAVFLPVANFGHGLGVPGLEPPELTFLSLVGLWYLTTLSIYLVLPAWLFVASVLNAFDEMEHRWIQEQYELDETTSCGTAT